MSAIKLTQAQKFAAARLKAVNIMPYFGLMLRSMNVLKVPRGFFGAAEGPHGTMGVTHNGTLLVQDDAIAAWSTSEIATILLHEVNHIMRRHSQRAEMASIPNDFRRLWNIAADCVAGGTMILMADGTERPIETLREGDEIQGVQKGRLVKGNILTVLARPRSGDGFELHVDNDMLRLTPEHRVLTKDGYVKVSEATKKKTTQVFRVRDAVYYGKPQNHDYRRDCTILRAPLSKCTISHEVQRCMGVKAYCQTTQTGCSCDRVWNPESETISQREANPKDAPDIQGTADLEHASYTAKRIHIPEGTVYYDLITTCHSFIANGYAVHNCEINDDLRSADLKFPHSEDEGGGVFPETFGLNPGLTAEEYYGELKKHVVSCPNCGTMRIKMKDNGFGFGDGDGSESGKGDGNGNGNGDGCSMCGAHGPANGWCGSGAGCPLPGEDTLEKDLKEMGMSDVEIQSLRRQVAEKIKEEHEKNRGNVPAGLLRLADEIIAPPKVDWRVKLAQCARNAIAYRPGAIDFKYDRPSRRQGAIGYGIGKPILPSIQRPVPRVAVAIDTSGSMSASDLTIALAETEGILKAVGAEITFMACDASVGVIKKVKNIKEACSLLVGGGGTSFVPVFDAIAKMNPMPEILIYLTDGYGNAPHVPPPKLRTVWVLVGSSVERTREPIFPGEKFGEIIRVDLHS